MKSADVVAACQVGCLRCMSELGMEEVCGKHGQMRFAVEHLVKGMEG